MGRQNHMMMEPLELYALVANGELKKFPNNYLDKQSIKEMVRHIVINVYKYTREDVLDKVDQSFLRKNFLGGAKKFFNYSNTEMLIFCFPEWDLKVWEFRQVPKGFWENEQNRRDFVLWVAQNERLDVNTKEGLRKITAAVLYKYGGGKPMRYAGGLYELLDTVACGKYKKWEIIKMVSWPQDEIIEATKWLIEERLCYSPKQVCSLKVADFASNNLEGMLRRGCNHSIFTALELTYPGRYCRDNEKGICLK